MPGAWPPNRFAQKLFMTNHAPVRKVKNLLCILLALLFFYPVSQAQPGSTRAGDTPALKKLPGFSQTIYYSTAQEERARNFALFMENAVAYFRETLQFTPRIQLYVLAPADWKFFAAKPLLDVYGFPHNVDPERLVIAAEDNDFWRSFLPPIGQLPPPLAAQVTKAYGKTDGSFSMKPFFDLLALHEMGHSYTAQAGLTLQRHWMSELFANLMLHTYIADKQPELLPALETFPGMVVQKGSAEYTYTSLADFERLYVNLGMGPKNYSWYQCKLHTAAKEIYNAGGNAVLKKLWKTLKNHTEKLTDDAFIALLKNEVDPSVANVYTNWEK